MFRLGLAVAFALVTVMATFIPVSLPFVSGQIPLGDGIRQIWQASGVHVGVGAWNLQMEAMLLAPLVLGTRLGTLSQILYVAAGLLGLPSFYQGGGTELWWGPTVGYIVAVLPACIVCGRLADRGPGGWLQHLHGAATGLLILQVTGTAFAMGRLGGIPWTSAVNSLFLWPVQGHLLLLLPLSAMTNVLGRLRPQGSRSLPAPQKGP